MLNNLALSTVVMEKRRNSTCETALMSVDSHQAVNKAVFEANMKADYQL